MHLHPPYLVTFTLAKRPVLFLTAASKLFSLPVVPAALAGTKELFDGITEALKNQKTWNIALEAHGTVSFAKTLRQAIAGAELIEETAKLAFCSQILKSLPV
jgi:ribulose-5-phosphate 4-epimerase/fuculose-1-phosphate aldolase